ncbi:MAG: response regulator transcription factor [Coprobacillus sp.]|uniref:LytR/AlgR family response regulator transcription factor n=1 Tax=Romboutsia ilealis TaxID=1115758 RepID=UPI002173EEAA|nr:LytTR family DNA-binding domain-containing protein [Romboutsia ilealis]MCI9050223.1 response regulator transcription factor [Coprobacillus sp.]
MKVLVCDDDKTAVETIIKIIHKTTPKEINISITGLSKTKDILENTERNSYDIAFLDIEMSSLNGIKLGAILQKKNPHCILIFISSYPQYVTDAFSIKAFQYLYKPIDEKRFQREYMKALQICCKIKATCIFNTLEGKKIIQPRDILYIETYYKRIKIVTIHEIFLSSIKNKQHVIETLKNFDFISVHQSFYVNMNHIYSVHSNYVTLYNHKQLPISIARSEDVKKAFHNFIIQQALQYPDF